MTLCSFPSRLGFCASCHEKFCMLWNSTNCTWKKAMHMSLCVSHTANCAVVVIMQMRSLCSGTSCGYGVVPGIIADCTVPPVTKSVAVEPIEQVRDVAVPKHLKVRA